jgi:eukaryotic-like serine/threonine-protein kinase
MQPGRLLRNHYRIESRLSAGGFGETYIAVDEDYPDRRQVVVKHLKPQSNNPAVLDMARRLFEAEAVTLAKLGEKTDLIPTLYAYFEEDREFYLVQEFIEGQTLTQELGTRTLSEAETLAIVREILAGLTEVHTSDIIHRDLKPDNIIRRSRDRKLVLIDFGAVKAVRQTILQTSKPQCSQSIGIGTTGYMPIEQAMGYPTSASDIYAVGAIALQCLTGELPSELFDESALEFKWQHLCTVSDRVATVLAKMVATRNSDRYANAMEAIQAIDALLIPAPIPIITPTILSSPQSPLPSTQAATIINATPQTPQPPVRKKIDRQVIKWVLLVGAGLIGLGAIVFGVQIAANEYSKSAVQKSAKGDYRGALSDYDLAIKLNSNSALFYFNRAVLKHDKLKDKTNAINDMKQAAKLYREQGKEKDYQKAMSQIEEWSNLF